MILPTLHIELERWKWNSDFELYVSTFGHFKDKNKQELKFKMGSDYITVLCPNGQYKSAHRLVLMTWRPVKNMDDLTVDHLNHNKRDNRLSNLEWITKEENQARAEEDLIETKPNKKQITEVYCRHHHFENFDAAAAWLIEDQGMLDTDVSAIAKRIKKAVRMKNSYCGRRWYINMGGE